MFRVNGRPAIGIAVAMREGGDILTLGRNIEQAMREIRADLPIGIEPVLVADQPFVVDHAVRDFTTSLWQAIAIIMAVSLVTLGLRPGAVIALSIPRTIALVLPVMEATAIDLQRISLGALIIALGLLVDDTMTTVDVMTSRLAAGDSKEEAATFAYRTLALPMLTGSFVTAAGFIPIGFARSTPARRGHPRQTKGQAFRQAQHDPPLFSRLPGRRHACALGHDRRDNWMLCRGLSRKPLGAATVLSAVRPSGPSGRPDVAAKCLNLCQRRCGRKTRRLPPG
jgi:AcrB/AcrD/AcrF family